MLALESPDGTSLGRGLNVDSSLPSGSGASIKGGPYYPVSDRLGRAFAAFGRWLDDLEGNAGTQKRQDEGLELLVIQFAKGKEAYARGLHFRLEKWDYKSYFSSIKWIYLVMSYVRMLRQP
jgi:hypothetical protein